MTNLTTLLGTLLLAGHAGAQMQHFPDIKWKERDTDHFMLRTHDTGTDPAKQNGEDVWEKSQEILTGLEEDFTKNEFRTPSGAKGSDTEPFRFTVYLVGSGHAYDQLLEVDQKRYGWSDTNLRSCRITRNYSDPLNRYIDFQEYYKNADKAEIIKGGVLGPEDPWPAILRKMCKKDERASLNTVTTAEIITLSPKTSGYIFALTYFLVSTDERQANYRKLVGAARDGKKITKELLLITYGYEDDEGFEKDWYDFIESSKFK
ncbi:MAG: hypothetical protein O3A87_09605 [Verrucomicrobia bacterium]|nr:hypothetical protein [Verrucomicrobiota bacterium]MDA1006714.1 hypothetical protein [Verrucomicrobiota bacterium]